MTRDELLKIGYPERSLEDYSDLATHAAYEAAWLLAENWSDFIAGSAIHEGTTPKEALAKVLGDVEDAIGHLRAWRDAVQDYINTTTPATEEKEA